MTKTVMSPPSLDLIFRAFCDRTRLRILYILRDGECCVGNLVDILGIEQPSASRHLAYLRKSGLVSVRNVGPWKYYSLAPATVPFHQKMLECLACCFSEVPEIQADQVRAREVRGAGGCCPGEEQPRPTQAQETSPQEKRSQKQANRRPGSDCCTS
jgi:ArsR family transcriptional regulator